MTEFERAARRLARDLTLAGAASETRAAATRSYLRALEERSDAAWRGFYEGLAEALRSVRAPRGPARPAVRRLLQILHDDFGAPLLEVRAGEAHVPS